MPNVRSGVFVQLNSTEPSFTFNSSLVSIVTAFESTARKWGGPVNRAVRIASVGTGDFFFVFGSSLVVASTAGLSALFLSPGTEIFGVTAKQGYLGAIATATDISFNVTLGSIA